MADNKEKSIDNANDARPEPEESGREGADGEKNADGSGGGNEDAAEGGGGAADGKPEDVSGTNEEEPVKAGEDGDPPSAAKGRKASKKEKKEKKDKKDAAIEDLNDRLMRLRAEFDNYRKRTDKEKTAMYDRGVSSMAEKIIPVIDNFERGFDSISEEDADNPFVAGMRKVYEQFVTTLSDMGVKAIEAVGKEFDPNMHNAVMHVEDESLGENVVAEEFQKGYMYNNTVLRCSMVKVAN